MSSPDNSKLPYILIKSNKKDDLPAIHLNHASDRSDTSAPSSPSCMQTNDTGDASTNASSSQNEQLSGKQKSSFFQRRKKQISVEPRLLIPKANLERSTSEKHKRPTSSCSDQPMTAPILTTERIRKPRASIAFDFNILHYLTKGHYFGGSSESKGFAKEKKNRFLTDETDDKQSDIDSFGSVISLIQRKEPLKTKVKKKKKKKKKTTGSDANSDEASDQILRSGKAKKNKQCKKVLKSDQSNLSSSSSSLLSLNNLSSSIEKISSKFKNRKEKSNRFFRTDEQMLHKHGRVIVASEPSYSIKQMMQWSPNKPSPSAKTKSNLPSSCNLASGAGSSAERVDVANLNKIVSSSSNNGELKPNVVAHHLPPSSVLVKDSQYNHHHHHSTSCPHTHQPYCNSINQPNFINAHTKPPSMKASTNGDTCLDAKQGQDRLIKFAQQSQSTKFAFFKNKILRSRSFDTPKNAKFNQVSFISIVYCACDSFCDD